MFAKVTIAVLDFIKRGWWSIEEGSDATSVGFLSNEGSTSSGPPLILEVVSPPTDFSLATTLYLRGLRRTSFAMDARM